jgi:hypothetical protein
MGLTTQVWPPSQAAVAQELNVDQLAACIEGTTKSLGRLVSAVGDRFSEVLLDIRGADGSGLKKVYEVSGIWHTLDESEKPGKQREIAEALSGELTTTGNKVHKLLSEIISQLTPSTQHGNSGGQFAPLERSLADWIKERSQFIAELGSKLEEGRPVCDVNSNSNPYLNESIVQFRLLLTQLWDLSADIYRSILSTEVESATLSLRDFLRTSGSSVPYKEGDAFKNAADATRIARDLLETGLREDSPLGRYKTISVSSAVVRLESLLSNISNECRYDETQKRGLSGSERTVAEILTELAASTGNVKHLIDDLAPSSKLTRLEHTLEQISRFGSGTKHFAITDDSTNAHAQRIHTAREGLIKKLTEMVQKPSPYLTNLERDRGISERKFYEMILRPLCTFGARGLEAIKQINDLTPNVPSSAVLKEVCLDVLTSELRNSSDRGQLTNRESIWFAAFATQLISSSPENAMVNKFVDLARECALIPAEQDNTGAVSA